MTDNLSTTAIIHYMLQRLAALIYHMYWRSEYDVQTSSKLWIKQHIWIIL